MKGSSVTRQPDSTGKIAFEISARVVINLDINLALELGDFIVESGPYNKAIWALGCQLRDLVPSDTKGE